MQPIQRDNGAAAASGVDGLPPEQRKRPVSASVQPEVPGLPAPRTDRSSEGARVSARFAQRGESAPKTDAVRSSGPGDAQQADPSRGATAPASRTLSEVVLRHYRGRPVFEALGKTVLEHASGDKWLVTAGVLHMNDRARLLAFRNETSVQAYDFSCHGYSLAGGGFYIRNRDMQPWLDHTPLLTKTQDPQGGDLVVYRERSGKIVHSAVLTIPGMVVMAGGAHMYNNGIRTTPPGGIAGPSKLTWVPVARGWTRTKASVEYWRPADAK